MSEISQFEAFDKYNFDNDEKFQVQNAKPVLLPNGTNRTVLILVWHEFTFE